MSVANALIWMIALGAILGIVCVVVCVADALVRVRVTAVLLEYERKILQLAEKERAELRDKEDKEG